MRFIHLFGGSLQLNTGDLVRLEAFELQKAVEALQSKAIQGRGTGTANEETTERIFDGTIPRRAVSRDNFDVVWHFPNAIGALGTVSVWSSSRLAPLTFFFSTLGTCRQGLRELGRQGQIEPESRK